MPTSQIRNFDENVYVQMASLKQVLSSPLEIPM